MYLLEARLNGVELVGSDRKRFMETLKRLSVERSNFRWDKWIVNNKVVNDWSFCFKGRPTVYVRWGGVPGIVSVGESVCVGVGLTFLGPMQCALIVDWRFVIFFF